MNCRSLLGVIGVAWFAAACTRGGSPSEARARVATGAGDIVVAAPWPWEARGGELRYAQGLDLAVKEINETGGIDGRRIRLIRPDDRQSVNEGRLIAQRLAEDPEVMAVIGHLQSYVTVPAAAIYDLAGLPLVSPMSTSAELTSRNYARIFRVILTDRMIGRQMADYAIDRGYRRAVIYYVRNEYGRALANAFEERYQQGNAEVEILARHSYDAGQDLSPHSLEPVLKAWANLVPDAIFLAGEVPQAGRIIAAIRAAGMDTPVLGPDAMSSSTLISEGGDAVEGTVVASFFHPDEPRDEVSAFVTRFRATYEVSPDLASALGYDAVWLLARAMRVARTPGPADVSQALRRTEWRGVTGDFRFDEQGELLDRHIIRLVVRGGKFTYLQQAHPGSDVDGVPARDRAP